MGVSISQGTPLNEKKAPAGSLPHSAESQRAAFTAMGDAVACVHKQSQTVYWATDALLRLVPTCVAGAAWTQVTAAVPELKISSDLWQGIQDHEKLRTLEKLQLSVQIAAFDSDYLLIRLASDIAHPEQVHAYMQARDDLFSKSRTISVSEMATTLAHEINTPIGTITNMLSGVKARLQRPEFDKEVLVNALDGALDQAQFTSSIIARIRDYTQARRPQQLSLDLSSLAREAVDMLDWYFATHRCRVQFDMPVEPVWIRGDAAMLQQVIINLLRNAVDAMRGNADERRQVVVAIKLKGERIRLLIEDCGHGLDSDTETLFVPFATNKPDGMGVGLNICRSFLELHQGRLWLTPMESGGCTATVELPFDKTSGEASSTGNEGNR